MKGLRLLIGFVLALALSPAAQAEPYLAIRYGLKCVACHVNPTGGGLRNAVGNSFAQNSIAANPLPNALQGWNGALLDDRLRLGGDFRTATTRTSVSGQPTTSVGGTEQARLYADVQIIKEYLGVHLDQQIAPGKAERQEAYVRLSTPGMGWYAKAGQFYLPFGWRLQDSLAFVRQLSGVSMTVPDKGFELGHESEQLSAQVAYTNRPGNSGSTTGHQLTSQIAWLQPWGRVGAAMARVTSTAGDRQAYGLFAGTTTGPVTWLGEVDVVSDAGFPEGTRRQFATLLEANWLVRQGHNLKLTAEYLDPDRRVAHDNKVRHSLVYEYTPIAFVQLRAGYRRFGGIPQNAVDNRRQTFVELHGLF
ncbi:hypothetical protein [Pelomonas sp. Root1444]|uniref:hypothetical protein n=1 Tax=Pelomonas sp. Root1444 TaxID=1736464 RepID=UPI000702CA69|nr:hypothetical protein [Pelomonas sp. Root1444]KQY88506.1 hypothetical protein ASD35_13170 [Pelomonas sp. Root1444]